MGDPADSGCTLKKEMTRGFIDIGF